MLNADLDHGPGPSGYRFIHCQAGLRGAGRGPGAGALSRGSGRRVSLCNSFVHSLERAWGRAGLCHRPTEEAVQLPAGRGWRRPVLSLSRAG